MLVTSQLFSALTKTNLFKGIERYYIKTLIFISPRAQFKIFLCPLKISKY